jgi:hypothetical protein
MKSGNEAGDSVHLSRRHKRDLLELAAAGVMSAVFFAAPVFLTYQRVGSEANPPVRSATPSTASQAPTAAVIPQVASPGVQVITTDVTAAVSTPALRRSASVSPAVRVSRPPARRSLMASARTRVPLGRRIARLFAGDGTHAVQPFPTVAATER